MLLLSTVQCGDEDQVLSIRLRDARWQDLSRSGMAWSESTATEKVKGARIANIG